MEHAQEQDGNNQSQPLNTTSDIVSGAAHEVAAALKQTASETAEAAINSGADRMTGLGRAVHGAADELGRELPGIGDYIHAAANRLEDAGSGLREQSLDDMYRSVNRFVRRKPAIAFVGLRFGGLIVSRLVKTSQ